MLPTTNLVERGCIEVKRDTVKWTFFQGSQQIPVLDDIFDAFCIQQKPLPGHYTDDVERCPPGIETRSVPAALGCFFTLPNGAVECVTVRRRLLSTHTVQQHKALLSAQRSSTLPEHAFSSCVNFLEVGGGITPFQHGSKVLLQLCPGDRGPENTGAREIYVKGILRSSLFLRDALEDKSLSADMAK